MKNLFLIALLFVLVTSKIEKINKSLLSIAKTFLSEEQDPDFGNPCEAATDANKWKKFPLSDTIPGAQCCYIKATIDGAPFPEVGEGICEVNIKPFAPYSNLAKSSQFIPFVREVVGFAPNTVPDIQDFLGNIGTLEVDWEDSKLELNVEIKEFSQEEQKL